MKGHALIGDVSREYSDNPPMAPDIPRVVVAAEPRFDFSGGEYAELFARSDATAFQHPLWLRHLFGTVAPRRDAEPCVVTGRDAEYGTLLFALPLMLRAKSGLTLLEAADLGVSDYAAPVIDRAWRRTSDLSDIAGDVAAVLPSHDILRIRPVREKNISRTGVLLQCRTACDSPPMRWRSGRLSGMEVWRLFSDLREISRPREALPKSTALAAPSPNPRSRQGDRIHGCTARRRSTAYDRSGLRLRLLRNVAVGCSGEAGQYVCSGSGRRSGGTCSACLR